MSRILLGLALLGMLTPVALAQTPTADSGAAPQGDGASAGDAAATPAPPPEAAAANQEFEAQVDAWNALVERLKPLQQQRDAATGAARTELETQIADMRRQTNETVDKIAEAGLRAYAAAPMAFPRVTSTLLAIAQFHVIGDAHGDGGDQYERALKICTGLIDAGAGEKWPVLYVLAGASAYNTGELDLAQQYLDKAESAGQFANVSPPRGDEPPAVKLLQDARQAMENLPIHRKHWDAERAIREAEAQADDLPRVKFTTNKGEIVIELFENEAPQSVANFITLVKQGYYNGVTFHRVLPLFMAQGGDPKGTGSGGPGYNIRDEQRAPKARRHFRGSLSMANTGQPNTGGSQFFLTFVPTSYLDGRHAVFGRVIQGMDVAASLKRRDPQAAGTKPTPDRILKAEVLRDRGHAYEFEKLSD